LSGRAVDFAAAVRRGRLAVWRGHLPAAIYEAIKTIDNAGWWLSNRDARADGIKFPASWAKAGEGNAEAK
jgi:hypothetical protein